MMTEGVLRITAERVRQIREKGHTLRHDREEHGDGSLGELAAMVLHAAMAATGPEEVEDDESRAARWCAHILTKHSDSVRRLEIAGALIAAEIDRLLAESDR